MRDVFELSTDDNFTERKIPLHTKCDQQVTQKSTSLLTQCDEIVLLFLFSVKTKSIHMFIGFLISCPSLIFLDLDTADIDSYHFV